MKKLLLSMGLLAVVSSQAQTVDYTYISKNHDLAPVKAAISFFNLDGGMFPISAGVLVQGVVKDKLFYTFSFRQGYTRYFYVPKDELLTTQKESKGRYIEAGADLIFWDKDKKGKVKCTTSSTSTSETYFKAEVDRRVNWAWSAGIFMQQLPKYLSSESYVQSGDIKLTPAKDYNYHFNTTTTGIYGGLSHRSIKKAKVSSDGWAYRRFINNRFFVHAMLGATAVGDIQVAGKTYAIDNKKAVPLGYRIGWEWDQHGSVTGFEIGKLPTVNLDPKIKGSALGDYMNYFRLTFHFWVFNGDRAYHLKEKKK